MSQSNLGLSGHNEYQAPALQTRVPPLTNDPLTVGNGAISHEYLYPPGQSPYQHHGHHHPGHAHPGHAQPVHFVSGDAQDEEENIPLYPHRHYGDWKDPMGPSVIRNNDLQYHYAEPYGFQQIILNSLNSTSVAVPENPSADFTVQTGTAKGTALQPITSNFRANAVILNDITLPQTQYLIEDEWSRLDFTEGINIYTGFRDVHVTFPNVYDNGHHVRATGKLPLQTNYIKSVSFESANRFVVEFEEDHSTNIDGVQKFWQNNLALQSFSAVENGHQVLGEEDANIEHISKRKLRITLTKNEVDTSTTEICGLMATTAIPSPLHLQDVTNSMLESAPHVRHDGIREIDHTTFDGDPAPYYMIPQYSLNFNWNAEVDKYEFTYTITSDYDGPQPELSGEILEYMGFNSPFPVPEFEGGNTSITVQAPVQRQQNAVSGTRIAPGHYETADALALAMENSLNGTWFGGNGQKIDDIDAEYFHIYFVDQNIEQRTLCVPAGRYTPCELASSINSSLFIGLVDISGLGCTPTEKIPIEAVPVFSEDGVEYLGIKFVSLNNLPFSIDFQQEILTGDPLAIDPRRLGYDSEFYRGQVIYSPKDEIPYYPVIIQGGQQRIFRSLQQYEVRNNPLTRKFSIVARPFMFRRPEAYGYLGNRTAFLEFKIAHGIPAGQHIFLKFRYSATSVAVVSATVLEQPPLECQAKFTGKACRHDPQNKFCCVCSEIPLALRGNNDPTIMNVCFGGTNPNPFDGVESEGVTVEFTSQNIWTLNTKYGVTNCIRREALGFDSNFYGFINESSAFRIPTNIQGLEFSTDTTFVFPYSYSLTPYQYVLVKITINRHQSQGNAFSLITDVVRGEEQGRGSETFIARIPIDTAHCNLDSKVFNIQSLQINKLGSVRVQIYNPDGTLYNFHGVPTSVGLAFSMVQPGL